MVKELKDWLQEFFGLKPGMALVVAGLAIWVCTLKTTVEELKKSDLEIMKSTERKTLNVMIEGFDRVDRMLTKIKNSYPVSADDEVLPPNKGPRPSTERVPSDENDLQEIIRDMKGLQKDISVIDGPTPQGERVPASFR